MNTDTSPMQGLERRVQDYADTLAEYNALTAQVRDEIKQATARHMAAIRCLFNGLKDRQADICAEIKAHPELFQKPKTRVIHGIKLGLRKRKGKLVIRDAAQTVQRIKALYQDDIGVLIKATETPLKSGLEKLSAKELKRLGVEVTDDSDEVVFVAAADELDDLIDFLMTQAGHE